MSQLSFFFRQFFRDFKHTGAVCPSSPRLTKNMLDKLDFNKCLKILELGPGNGCMTKEILKRMRDDAELICIEINPQFCQHLRTLKTDKKLTIIQADASQLSALFEMSSMDGIISGLPLANFSKAFITSVFEGIDKILKKNSPYIQFQYTFKLDRFFKRSFSSVCKSFSFINIPPAIVYTCVT